MDPASVDDVATAIEELFNLSVGAVSVIRGSSRHAESVVIPTATAARLVEMARRGAEEDS